MPEEPSVIGPVDLPSGQTWVAWARPTGGLYVLVNYGSTPNLSQSVRLHWNGTRWSAGTFYSTSVRDLVGFIPDGDVDALETALSDPASLLSLLEVMAT